MYSTQALKYGVTAALIGSVVGCSRVEDTATRVAEATAEQTFVVESRRDSLDHGSIALIALDFSTSRREAGPGDRQIDSVHPLPGAMTGCEPDNERAYLAAIGTDLHPQDSGYVGTVQVELSNSTSAPDAASTMCFAVHTRRGGWTWHWAPVPITIDRGTRDFTGEPGAGHFDLEVNTADVDLIALMMAYGQDALTRVSYTAVPTLR